MTRILSFLDQTQADNKGKMFASRTNGCLGWSVGLLVIAIIAAILYPLFAQPKITHHRSTPLTIVKQLGVSILIYQADNDERFPHATAMPGLRALIKPYSKNDLLFQPTEQCAAPEFNFNYAGIETTQIPMGYKNQLEPDQTTLWYALCTLKDQPGVFRSRIDGSAKFSKLEPFFETFLYQFDRTNVTLAPPDYLTD